MLVALVDLVVVVAGYLLTYVGGRALGLPSPGILAIIAGVLLATWRLAASGESWVSVGLRKPPSWLRFGLSVVALYFISVAAVVGIVMPLAEAMGWSALDVSAYDDVRGNPAGLARILLVVWTTAAFGEEMLFRGFLQGRIQRLLGNGRGAMAGSVLLQALAFSAGHFYLGAQGVATALLVGLIYGSWYLLRGRNLWPLVIAHGLVDTVSMVAIYGGFTPG